MEEKKNKKKKGKKRNVLGDELTVRTVGMRSSETERSSYRKVAK